MGDLAISIVILRLDLVAREGFLATLVVCLTPSFAKSVLGSFNGMFRAQWRSSPRRMGVVSRSASFVSR